LCCCIFQLPRRNLGMISCRDMACLFVFPDTFSPSNGPSWRCALLSLALCHLQKKSSIMSRQVFTTGKASKKMLIDSNPKCSKRPRFGERRSSPNSSSRSCMAASLLLPIPQSGFWVPDDALLVLYCLKALSYYGFLSRSRW